MRISKRLPRRREWSERFENCAIDSNVNIQVHDPPCHFLNQFWSQSRSSVSLLDAQEVDFTASSFSSMKLAHKEFLVFLSYLPNRNSVLIVAETNPISLESSLFLKPIKMNVPSK